MMRLTVLAIVLSVCAAACTSPEQEKAKRAAAEQHAVEATAATAARVAPTVTGLWDEPHLVNRLVRAGLAPQAIAGEAPEAYWNTPLLAYHVGTATLYAYIYSDSLSRRRITDGLDSLTLAPRGKPGAYAVPHALIVQNNLAVVLVGANDRKLEQVSLAIGAGLPIDPGK
jgi:hypothetical protein